MFTGKPKKSTALPQLQCHCGVQCVSDEDYSNHVKSTHHAHVWHCSYPDCTKFYDEGSKVWKHFRTQHLNLYNHECPFPECDFAHEEMNSLKKHMHDAHRYKTDLICKKCGTVFGQLNKMKAHEQLCGHKMKIFPCPEESCTKGFRSKFMLSSHLKAKHPKPGEEAQLYICSVCAKSFMLKQSLSRHMQGHQRKEPQTSRHQSN